MKFFLDIKTLTPTHFRKNIKYENTYQLALMFMTYNSRIISLLGKLNLYCVYNRDVGVDD